MDTKLREFGPETPLSLASTAKPERPYGIVVFSHLRWSFVWQRPQQFLSRFAKNHPILFVEEPDYRLAEGDEPVLVLDNAMPNVTVAQIHLPATMRGREEVGAIMRQFARDAIESVDEDGNFDEPLLWYYSPMEAAWSLGYFENRGVVYDCMDELSQFRGAPKELIDNELRLIRESDIVFTGGYELWTKKSRQHPNVHFFGCGVEYQHFSKAQDTTLPIPNDLRDLHKPIVGWFGVVDERVDYDLLAKLAELRPQYSFVVVGPACKVDPNDFPKAENLHWLGGRDYKVLPDYCRGYDVCMMCFALNEATQYINPTKALEYLATGKPVVSTPVADVVRQYGDTVSIADTPEAFAAAIDAAIQSPDPAKIANGIRRAMDSSWESTVEKMQSLIDQAIDRRTSAQAA